MKKVILLEKQCRNNFYVNQLHFINFMKPQQNLDAKNI